MYCPLSQAAAVSQCLYWLWCCMLRCNVFRDQCQKREEATLIIQQYKLTIVYHELSYNTQHSMFHIWCQICTLPTHCCCNLHGFVYYINIMFEAWQCHGKSPVNLHLYGYPEPNWTIMVYISLNVAQLDHNWVHDDNIN